MGSKESPWTLNSRIFLERAAASRKVEATGSMIWCKWREIANDDGDTRRDSLFVKIFFIRSDILQAKLPGSINPAHLFRDIGNTSETIIYT